MKKEKTPIKGKLLLDRQTIRHLKRILSKEDLMHVAGGGEITSIVDTNCTEPH
jgi:hypothetical protein